MAGHFIGIDVGTGSARAGVFDRTGRMLATAKNVELDHRMSPRAQSEADDLLRRDVDVDRMYVEDLARDSADMIALYEAARDTSRDPDIRQYAETMLPALRSNQRQAEDRLARAGLARE